jgi:hypothetical protein
VRHKVLFRTKADRINLVVVAVIAALLTPFALLGSAFAVEVLAGVTGALAAYGLVYLVTFAPVREGRGRKIAARIPQLVAVVGMFSPLVLFFVAPNLIPDQGTIYRNAALGFLTGLAIAARQISKPPPTPDEEREWNRAQVMLFVLFGFMALVLAALFLVSFINGYRLI